ncbi:hypothetical protein GCM10009641_81840 [Mycobacterium cookii]|uniref:Peptidase MA-like domain-containing protein n=1 Tax=Nocardioides furvisabuli TaxID=375542 RepID=A0ABN2WLP3_9ACTN|nr:hypothetical protein [Nocardioides furvisabuli]
MAGLSLFVVAAVVVALVQGGRHDVEPATVDVPRASPRDAAEALASLVDGVGSRDADALASLAPAGNAVVGEQLAGIAGTAAALDLRAVSARYVDQVGTVASDGSWSGTVDLTWRVARLDAAPARAEVVVTFVPDDGRLAVAGFSAGGAARVPLWLRGRLAVATAPGVLVMVDGTGRQAEAEAEAVLRRVERGIDVVRRVLPQRIDPVVVEVPASAGDLDETLGVRPGTYAGIAAVTAPVGKAAEGPVHVFVNPDLTAGLRRAGAQVVMSHELVHIATDAVRRPVEPWLLEGFADYVALRDAQLPDRVTLGRAIEAARRDGVPSSLPSRDDFDTRARDLQARYEEAWLACRVLAERLGEPRLVAAYEGASRGVPLDRALRQAGLSTAELTALWRAELRRLVG